jgi:hypothetical protein
MRSRQMPALVAPKRLTGGLDSFGGGPDELRDVIGVGDHRDVA